LVYGLLIRVLLAPSAEVGFERITDVKGAYLPTALTVVSAYGPNETFHGQPVALRKQRIALGSLYATAPRYEEDLNMNGAITRRALLKGSLIAGALVPVASLFIGTSARAEMPPLDPNDPAARGRDYVTKSAKSVAYCGNCALYKKTAESTGSCSLFAGKSVEFAGWCSGWVKIGL
jgi:High potential iron-sulfur protein